MLEKILHELSGHPSISVIIGSGIEGWNIGEVILTVHGNGKVAILNKRNRTERVITAKLEADRVTTFGKFLAEHNFTQSRTSKMPRKPGDVPVWLRIIEDDNVLFEANLWHGDRYEDNDLDAILSYTDTLIEELTNGALPYGKK